MCPTFFLYSIFGRMLTTALTLQLGFYVATEEYVVICESKGAQRDPMTITSD